ncbi:hypothetical protein EYE40_00590 [Glaciihabitans arcticus]|uniref:Uncharacterized protein n=1 Tax=Glaciihabitans arcticus TaxID=2668039 RepID=A0A4Q9GTY1_9MICO|nr:hypothetical protein [Glaciihabitans arcticus]TBN56013.1 hypothetical protein EYE40_00590 [Glaciihabitans arcticus]
MSRLGRIALATTAGLFSIVVAFGIVIQQSVGDPGENCYSKQFPPEGLHPSPEGQFNGQAISYFPFGMACNWTMADESSYEQPNPNPLPTVFLYGGLISVLFGPTLITRRMRTKVPSTPSPE